jgi:hypothetical protein
MTVTRIAALSSGARAREGGVVVPPPPPPPPPPPSGDVPPPAWGIRESGTPGMDRHELFKRRYGGHNLYRFFRADGERGSEHALRTAFGRFGSQAQFYHHALPGQSAIMSNWPICVGSGGNQPGDNTSSDARNQQLRGAANGMLDNAWRAALREIKRLGLNYYVFCCAIEGNGGWYPWGTGAHEGQGGWETRADLQREAHRRFVRIATAPEFRDMKWIFTYSPTLEAWNGSGRLNAFLQRSFPGKQYTDAAWPTFYDRTYSGPGGDCRGLPNGYSAGEIATRDAKWRQRWDHGYGHWVNNFTNWARGLDIATGFHELAVWSGVVGHPVDSGAHRNQPVVHGQLEMSMGSDNDLFTHRMIDWCEDQRNKCIGISWFFELYKHDQGGFYSGSMTPPYSQRHPRAAEAYRTRLQAKGPGDIRKNIEYVIARRPAGFGT